MNDSIRKQINLYYLYIALIGTWFTSGVVLFFNRKFLTDANIGVLEAVAFGVGLLAEIPSGTIADVFGRRKTVMLGVIISGIGFGIWGLAVASWMVVLGVLLFSLGTALQSGADEAMMYDYLKSHGQEKLWSRISANGGIIARLSYVVAIFIGGVTYMYYDRFPFLLRGLTFFLMLIPLIKLVVVDKFQETHLEKHEPKHYFSDFKNGIKELFHARISWIILLFLMVQGVCYTVFTAGILRPLLYEKSGLVVGYHSFAISISLILTIITMLIIREYKTEKVKKSVIYGFCIACSFGLSLSIGSTPMVLVLIGLTIVQVASYSLMPLLSTSLNSSISSRYRATTLSTASFLQGIVYVIAAPLVGYLSYKGLINEVAIGATFIVALGIVISLVVNMMSVSRT